MQVRAITDSPHPFPLLHLRTSHSNGPFQVVRSGTSTASFALSASDLSPKMPFSMNLRGVSTANMTSMSSLHHAASSAVSLSLVSTHPS